MTVVKLNINNRDFEIECGLGQEDALINLSYELDGRIKENANIFGDTNTSLLFAITALQLLDEVNDLKNAGQSVAPAAYAPAQQQAPAVNTAVDVAAEVAVEVEKQTIATLSQISGRIEQMAELISKKAS